MNKQKKKPVTTGGMESSIDWLTPEWRRLSRDAVKHLPPHFITQQKFNDLLYRFT